jgi:radical SAM protein with 4Fe4S-binding SPASM domain
MIIEKSNLRLNHLTNLLKSSKIEVTIDPLSGLPDYTSPYLEFRDLIGKNLLQTLLTDSERSSLSLNQIWDLRCDFPIAACFNVHSVCNEACVMCPYDDYSKITEHRVMQDIVFDKIINEFILCGGKILTFNNFSDIFAHASGIKFIERIFKFPEIELYIVTNGLNMKPTYIDKIIDIGFTGITYISCHAFSQDTFKKVTQRDGFYNVLNNITYLAKKHPHPERIIVQYAVDYSSIDEVIQAQEYWGKLGVSLNLFNTHTFAGNSQHREENFRSSVLAGCKGWGHDAGQPFYQIVIQANGDVTLCCHDLANSVVLGNVTENSIYEVWNSEKFYQVIGRIYLNNGHNDMDLICRKCQLAQYCQEK